MTHKKERVKLFIKYVLPSTLAMVSVFLFTVIDGIFVGRGVGTDGLGAVNIAFPFVMFFTAFVMLANIGGLTITAVRKGRGDQEGMNIAFMHSIAAVFVISALFSIAGTVFVKQMTVLMGANATFFDMVSDYIFWYAVFMIPCGMCMAFNGFCRNDGDPVLVSVSTVIATTLNIFGDWLFVFPLHMGLKGAAIATGISQSLGLLITSVHFIRKKGTLRFQSFKASAELYGKMFLRGLPECIAQFNAPICIVLTNIVILKYLGDTAENAFSVIGYVAAFSIAAFAGVAEGLQPLFGNCYGAGNEEDLLWYRKTGLAVGFTGALLIYVLLLFVGRPICSLYGLDEATMECTMNAMPRYSTGFFIQALTVIMSSYLYSTTRSAEAITVNVLRSFIVNTVVILLLPRLIGPENVWLTFPVYESIVMIAAFIIMKRADSRGIFSGEKE